MNEQRHEEKEEFWLPEEVWLVVAGYLRDAREVLKFGAVCKGWREISREARLWRGLLEGRWPRIASIDGLLSMRRGHAGRAGRVERAGAKELLELYQELHREALFLPQPLEGGSNHRLEFFKGMGPKRTEHAWTYVGEGLPSFKAVLHFEDAVFLLSNSTMGTPGQTSELHILDARTGTLRAKFTIDMLLDDDPFAEDCWSLGISERHRLLVVATPNLIQACPLDALFSPTGTAVPSCLDDPSEEEAPELPAVSWRVKIDARVDGMAVVDLHSRVYLQLAPTNATVALCAVSLPPPPPRDKEVMTDSWSTPSISAV